MYIILKSFFKKLWGLLLIMALIDTLSILAIMVSVNTSTGSGVQKGKSNKILVVNAVSPSHFLPTWYINGVKEIEGVLNVSSITPLPAQIDDEEVSVILVDSEEYIAINNIVTDVLPKEITKNRVLLSDDLKYLSRNLGRSISVTFNNLVGVGNRKFDLEVAGFVTHVDGKKCTHCIIADRSLAEEISKSPRQVVSQLIIQVSEQSKIKEISKKIDDKFSSEQYKTKSIDFDYLNELIDESYRVIGDSIYVVTVLIAVLVLTMKVVILKFYFSKLNFIVQKLKLLGMTNKILLRIKIINLMAVFLLSGVTFMLFSKFVQDLVTHANNLYSALFQYNLLIIYSYFLILFALLIVTIFPFKPFTDERVKHNAF